MTSEQFQRAVNSVGYCVIASPVRREPGDLAIIPPFDDGVVPEYTFRFDREATYQELCAYTSAAFGTPMESHKLETEWRKEWAWNDPCWLPYIARTD